MAGVTLDQLFSINSAARYDDLSDDAQSRSHQYLLTGAMPTEYVVVALLLPADSPRQKGENIEHTRMLAGVEAKLPPIVVHRSTMRVIDGMHRLGAARMRGDEKIEVRFFDGTEHEAFVLAVELNIAHGLPLSRADRTRAAERIIASHPTWSDRAVAAAAGLGARTVGNIRQQVQAGSEIKARVGRDGRVRPLDHTEGRVRASEIIKTRPDASLREIARDAGVSPSTARDVRQRIQRGEDPVHPVRPAVGSPVESGLASMLRGLKRDPSLRLTESGRSVLRWIFSRAIRMEEWRDVSGNVPAHCTYILADVARQCAEEWLQIANDLETRVDQRPAGSVAGR
jgi:ParB-like chromosome segregation protein Spo0J